MAITLGKDCSISVGGSSITGARNASISYQLRTITIDGMDTTDSETVNCGLDCTLNFETNEPNDVSALISSMTDRSSWCWSD